MAKISGLPSPSEQQEAMRQKEAAGLLVGDQPVLATNGSAAEDFATAQADIVTTGQGGMGGPLVGSHLPDDGKDDEKGLGSAGSRPSLRGRVRVNTETLGMRPNRSWGQRLAHWAASLLGGVVGGATGAAAGFGATFWTGPGALVGAGFGGVTGAAAGARAAQSLFGQPPQRHLKQAVTALAAREARALAGTAPEDPLQQARNEGRTLTARQKANLEAVDPGEWSKLLHVREHTWLPRGSEVKGRRQRQKIRNALVRAIADHPDHDPAARLQAAGALKAKLIRAANGTPEGANLDEAIEIHFARQRGEQTLTQGSSARLAVLDTDAGRALLHLRHVYADGEHPPRLDWRHRDALIRKYQRRVAEEIRESGQPCRDDIEDLRARALGSVQNRKALQGVTWPIAAPLTWRLMVEQAQREVDDALANRDTNKAAAALLDGLAARAPRGRRGPPLERSRDKDSRPEAAGAARRGHWAAARRAG